jgi:hypothetical protein
LSLLENLTNNGIKEISIVQKLRRRVDENQNREKEERIVHIPLIFQA